MKQIGKIVFLMVCLNSYGQSSYFHLGAKMDGILLLENGNETNFWGYGPFSQNSIATLPAPLLIVNEGDSVEIQMTNQSPEAHTIHLHGLDVNQANDGVPQTSFFIFQNQSASYNFKANHSGTYLYHCHVTTTLHLTMGMYGMMVVERDDNTLYDNGPEYVSSHYFLTSDLEIETNDNPILSFPFHEIEPDYFMINGKSGSMLIQDENEHIEVPEGENVVLRLGNIAYAKTKYFFPEELNATVYMSDGRAIPNPVSVDSLEIYPGERYSVIINVLEAFSDSVRVDYISMENNNYLSSNFLLVNSSGISGDDELTNKPFRVFPNPSNGQFYFNQFVTKVNVYDSLGRICYQAENIKEMNLASLHSGIYLLEFEKGLFTKLLIQN